MTPKSESGSLDVAAAKVTGKADCTEDEAKAAFEVLATWQLRNTRQYRGTVPDLATLHRDFGVSDWCFRRGQQVAGALETSH